MLRTDWSSGMEDYQYPVRLIGQFDKSPEFQQGWNEAILASEAILSLDTGNREENTEYDFDDVINAWLDAARELGIISDTDEELGVISDTDDEE